MPTPLCTTPKITSQKSLPHSLSKKHLFTTLGLCFLFAMIEGFDLQAMGVAAPRMKAEMGLDASQIGMIFSASTLGTLPGALIAGKYADMKGRKFVLIACILVFGVTSFAVPFIQNFNLLLVIRFLTGLGLGGALPLVITIMSEAVSAQYKNTAVSAMYWGMPLGGLSTSVIALTLTDDDQWRHIFYVGGILPLILMPFLYFFLPESKDYLKTSQDKSIAKVDIITALFAPERVGITLSLWISFFGTALVLALLQNWLPTLMASIGLSRADGSYVQMGFNIGGAIGVLMLGFMADRMNKAQVILGVYIAILLALISLSISTSLGAFVLSAAAGGMFVIGGQSILYSLAATYYPTQMRGSGVGTAVSVGRLGSFVGPLAAGFLLNGGKSAMFVIASTIPLIVIATAAALYLLKRPQAISE